MLQDPFGLALKASALGPRGSSSAAAAPARSAWKPAAEGGWKRSTVLSVSRTRKAQGLRPRKAFQKQKEEDRRRRRVPPAFALRKGIEQEWTMSHGLPGLVDAPLLCPGDQDARLTYDGLWFPQVGFGQRSSAEGPVQLSLSLSSSNLASGLGQQDVRLCSLKLFSRKHREGFFRAEPRREDT